MYLSEVYRALNHIRNEIDKESWVSIRLLDSDIDIRVTTFIGDKVNKAYEKRFSKREIELCSENTNFDSTLINNFIKEAISELNK